MELPPKPTDAERYWSRVVVTDGCWGWTGATDTNGYAVFPLRRKPMYAHRWIVEHVTGEPIPPGMTVDHVRERGCTSKACSNPDHLEVVSYGENTRRGDSPPGVAQRTNTCRYGHSEWYTYPDGRRRCRVCQRESDRRNYARRTAQSPLTSAG